MAKIRELKPDDQINIDKASKILQKTVDKHPEIEPSLWTSACLSSIAQAYIDNDISKEDFIAEMTKGIQHYQTWFD